MYFHFSFYAKMEKKEACKKAENFSVENLLYEAWEKTEKHYNSIVHSNQQLTDNSQFNPEAMSSFFNPSEDDFRIQGNEAHYLGNSNPDFLATESSHFFSENCQNSEEVFNVSQHFEVDIKTDFDGVDKNLIDSIVKPFKTTSKNNDKKAYFPSQPNLMSQAMNYPHKPSLLQNKGRTFYF